MRKILIYSCQAFLCAGILCACNAKPANPATPGNNSDKITVENMVGSYSGSGFAMGQNETYDASFMNFTLKEDKSFELEDNSTNELILEGSVGDEKEQSLSLEVKKVESDVVQGWSDLKEDDTITCYELNQSMIGLSYDNICYIFEKSNSSLDDFSLLDYTVSDLWYSNDGSSNDHKTYEITVEDTSFTLYEMRENEDPKQLASFIYENNDKENYNFFTYRAKGQEMPAFLSDLPDGYSSLPLKIEVEDNEMTLTSDQGSLTLYSNLIYGLETGSDAYTLCDTSFIWAFDNDKHFCYFTMNPDTDTLYLYISDGEAPEYSASTTCGEVRINQKEGIMTYLFDAEASEFSASNDDPLYQKCEAMNGKEMKYSINEKVLTLNIDGKNYNFNLSDY